MNAIDNRCCVIFPHIPKTGGSSLKAQFKKSNLRCYFDSDYPPHQNKFLKNECERRNEESSHLDFTNFDIVFGHFPIKRYQRKNYQNVTLLRHPLDRSISQFFYWKNVLSNENVVALKRNPIIKKIKNGEVDFVKFIKRSHIANVYKRFICPLGPSDFLLVGFFEEYDEFLAKLSNCLGVSLDSEVHLRRGKKEVINEKDLHQVKKILKSEIDLYDAFKSYWT